MTAQNRTALKGYFNTGDTPTEANFSDLVDSFPLVSEIQTPVQTALDLKANLASPTITTPTLAGATMSATLKHTEVTSTPSGTTQTVNLNNGNHQTISLASTTGNPTITLTVPSSASSAGTLILKQHGTTPRDVTWAVSSGTIAWSEEPTWASDAAASVRVIGWRWDGSVMYLGTPAVFA